MKLDMSNALHYDLAAAIRGPDADSSFGNLKLVTTAVLRGLVGVPIGGAGAVMQPGAAWRRLAYDQGNATRTEWRGAQLHWQNHIKMAFSAAIKLKIKGAAKYWNLFQKMLAGNVPSASYTSEYSRLR